jgi:protease secretion system membrane fusion protein
VIPSNESLIVEGQLPVHLVDRAHAGESVELMFTAFNQNRTPHIQAQLLSVGADRITDERTGSPYYKVQAAVTPEGLQQLSELKLKVRPGMPVEMFIKTGERSLMSYLLKPLLDRTHSAMSEE